MSKSPLVLVLAALAGYKEEGEAEEASWPGRRSNLETEQVNALKSASSWLSGISPVKARPAAIIVAA
jgi:hypothetical protein